MVDLFLQVSYLDSSFKHAKLSGDKKTKTRIVDLDLFLAANGSSSVIR